MAFQVDSVQDKHWQATAADVPEAAKICHVHMLGQFHGMAGKEKAYMVDLAGGCCHWPQLTQDWWTGVGLYLTVVCPGEVLLARVRLPVQFTLCR